MGESLFVELQPWSGDIMMSPDEIAVKELTYSEARALTDRIREHRDELRLEVYQAWAGKAWLALGHTNWKDYVIKEFHESQTSINQELRAARIEMIIDDDPLVRNCEPGKSDASIGKRQEGTLRPLGRLLSPNNTPAPEGQVEPTPPDRKEKIQSAYREASAATNGHPTGAAVKAVLDRIPPQPPTRKSLFNFKVKMNPCDEDQYANWEAAQRFWNNQAMWVREVGGITGYTRKWTPRQRTHMRANLQVMIQTMQQWVDEFQTVEREA